MTKRILFILFFISISISIFHAKEAFSLDGPDTKYKKMLFQCLNEVNAQFDYEATEAHLNEQSCIGVAANICENASAQGKSTIGIEDCFAGETQVWDEMLNRYYKIMMDQLKSADADKLKNIQRSWIKLTQDKCGLESEGEGSVTGLRFSACYLHETANQALWLKNYAEEAFDGDKDEFPAGEKKYYGR